MLTFLHFLLRKELLEEIKEAAEQSIASQEGIRTIKLLDVTDALAKKIPEGKKEKTFRKFKRLWYRCG